MDNPNKKKADRKRIALGQPHELAYLRKSAKVIIGSAESNSFRRTNEHGYEQATSRAYPYVLASPEKIKRVAKAFLLLSSKKIVKKIVEDNESKTNLLNVMEDEIIWYTKKISELKVYLIIAGIVICLMATKIIINGLIIN